MILEERILKILRKEIPETLRETGKQRASKEIGTFIKENYYPKEFVEYIVTHKDLEISLGLKSAYQYWLEHPELQKTK
jgi:hypothetical protein